MDLSVARARPGDGTQWDWPQPRSQRAFGPRSPLQERRTHRKAAPVYGPSLCRAASPVCSAARRMRPTCWLGAATAWSTDSNAITLSGWRAPLTRKVIVPAGTSETRSDFVCCSAWPCTVNQFARCAAKSARWPIFGPCWHGKLVAWRLTREQDQYAPVFQMARPWRRRRSTPRCSTIRASRTSPDPVMGRLWWSRSSWASSSSG